MADSTTSVAMSNGILNWCSWYQVSEYGQNGWIEPMYRSPARCPKAATAAMAYITGRGRNSAPIAANEMRSMIETPISEWLKTRSEPRWA